MVYYHLSQKDAVEYLRTIPDGFVDCIVTDPAYESLEKHRKIGTTTRLKQSKSSSNEWFEIFPNSRFEELLVELYRVLKKHRHMYIFCDQETMFILKPIAEAIGFRFWKPIVWDKMKMGTGYHYRARCEFILFFEKGKRNLNSRSIPDVIECQDFDWDNESLCPDIIKIPSLRGKGRYPTEKPADISAVVIGNSTQPGEIVLDPFMGSGSVGEAAGLHDCHFLGNDLGETSFRTALKRMSELGHARSDDRHLSNVGLVQA